MYKLKIIIITIIVVISLFFIFNATYFDTKSIHITQEESLQYETGYEFLNDEGDKILLQKVVQDHNFSANKTYINRINYTDKIYFSSRYYPKVNIETQKTEIQVGSGGLYIFDIFDLKSGVTIYGNDFEIKLKSPGKIYLDNSDRKNIKIFSIDSIFELFLMDRKEQMTNMVMYPKMFIGFNISRNKYLKNADIFRIESMSTITYLKEEFFQNGNKIHSALIKLLNPLGAENINNFVSYAFSIIYSESEKKKYNPKEINLLGITNDLQFDFIDKYFVLFLNDEKKSIYYKKKIITQLKTLFQLGTSFDSQKVLYNLDELKKLNNKEYESFKMVLYYYYDNLVKINSLDYIDNTIALGKIISYMEGNGEKNIFQKSDLFINKVYSLVNANIYKPTFLQQNLLSFLEFYFSENQVIMDEKYKIEIKDAKIIPRTLYLLFFSRGLVLNNLDFSDTKNLESVFKMLIVFTNLNESIYQELPKNQTETLIIRNSLLFDKILLELRNNFFQEELTSNGLLALKSGIEIDAKVFNMLNTSVRAIFKFYSVNENTLSAKNKSYKILYMKNIALYNQYYLALNNYTEYLIKYDKESGDLLSAKTVLEKGENTDLSQDKLLNYLSVFEGIDVSNMKVQIIGGEYYKIENVIVNGEYFSFNLRPKQFYRMDDIIKGGEKLKLTYELESIKMDWQPLFENADEKKKDQYNFSKFFINMFFSNQQTSSESEIQIEDEIEQEDKIIAIFKRDKLLGERGDFTILKDYLDLKYKDVEVTYDNTNYNIKLKNIILQTSIRLHDESRKIIGELNSDYIFSVKDHYFINIDVKFYDPDRYKDGEKIYLFGGQSLKIRKKVNVVDFKTEMDKMISAYFTNNY